MFRFSRMLNNKGNAQILGTVLAGAVGMAVMYGLMELSNFAMKNAKKASSASDIDSIFQNARTVFVNNQKCLGAFVDAAGNPLQFNPNAANALTVPQIQTGPAGNIQKIVSLNQVIGSYTVKKLEITKMSNMVSDLPGRNMYYAKLLLSAELNGAPNPLFAKKEQTVLLSLYTTPAGAGNPEPIYSCTGGMTSELSGLKKQICEEISGAGSFNDATQTCSPPNPSPGLTSCPGGMTLIGSAGQSNAFCMDSGLTRASTCSGQDAVIECWNAGLILCSYEHAVVACNSGPLVTNVRANGMGRVVEISGQNFDNYNTFGGGGGCGSWAGFMGCAVSRCCKYK